MSDIQTVVFLSVIFLGFVGGCIYFYRKRRRGRRRSPKRRPLVLSSKDVYAMFCRLMEEYEKRFLSVALTKQMSEKSVPFDVRRRVWVDYPCEYSDPVIGISSISEKLGVTDAEVYAILPQWYAEVGIVPRGEMDGVLISGYLHERAWKMADSVFLAYSRCSQPECL